MASRERPLFDEHRALFNPLDLMRLSINRVQERRVLARASKIVSQGQPVSFKEIGILEYLAVDREEEGKWTISHEMLLAPDDSVYTVVEIATEQADLIVTASQRYVDHHGMLLEEPTSYRTATGGRKNSLSASIVMHVLEKAQQHGAMAVAEDSS